MTLKPKTLALIALVAAGFGLVSGGVAAQPPDGFVNVREVIPDIVLDIRYATPHNFVGRPIPGYEAAECLLTRPAAEALGRVQTTLHESGLGLKIYDCYRPQRAVDAFVAWGRDLGDQLMKPEFYPNVSKEYLFRDGYIAERSGHSRGSTVDLTIVARTAQGHYVAAAPSDLRSCENPADERFPDASLDMGTGYDCFSVLSHTLSPSVAAGQRANRLLLKQLMEANGFLNLPEEWWHYTLVNEPYPEAYFNFPVR